MLKRIRAWLHWFMSEPEMPKEWQATAKSTDIQFIATHELDKLIKQVENAAKREKRK